MKDIVKGKIENSNRDSSVNSLFSEDSSVLFPEEEIQDKAKQNSKKIDNDKIYSEACAFLKDVEHIVRAKDNPDIKKCFAIAKNIASSFLSPSTESVKVDILPKNTSLIFRAIEGYSDKYDDFVTHSVNVAIYSVKIAINLQYKKKPLIDLCASALLHDIGMLKISDKILKKTASLTDKERDIIKGHPQLGFNTISAVSKDYLWMANIILQEHEREDGSGYPNGLMGEDTHEYAKIIGITDVFEAMTHMRPYKKPMMPFRSVTEIIRSRNRSFAPKIIKALLKGLSIFPVGSHVKLNSKEVGKVVSIDEKYPLRPIVEIEYDLEGHKLPHTKIVDLRRDSILFINNVF